MRMRYVVALVVLISALVIPARSAQNQSSSDGVRRIVRKVSPMYPEAAKRINLSGTVKVIAVVAADGNVKSVEALGGSPVLIPAARDAVSKWKFAPGVESRESIEIHFSPF
jgi:TonB family protein